MANLMHGLLVGSFFMSVAFLIFGFMGAFIFLTTVGYYQEYKDRKALKNEASVPDSSPH